MGWNRKELKSAAKKTMKRNYVQVVIVCLVVAFIAGGYFSHELNLGEMQADSNVHMPVITDSISDTIDNVGLKTAEILEQDVVDKLDTKFNIRNATEGFFATIINNTAASKSFLVGILNTINQFIFRDKLLESSIMAIATLITIGFWLFVQNILIVGECRFHLENKYYSESSINRLLFIYRIKKTAHVAYIMFCKFLFNALWFLTIAGGFIKFYSYKMIPYIVAENPNISRKDAFKLSAEMMRGNKWATFKLDLSFILWHLLSIVTFGVAAYLYVNPLIGTTRAGLYFSLRETAKVNNIQLSEYLNDEFLTSPPTSETLHYPTDKFTIPERYKKDSLELNHDRKYSVSSYILIFFSVCFIGWIWEVFLKLFEYGKFVNRGTLIGPWLPIYGTGALLILILLKPLINKPIILFPSIFVLCGSLEYFTSWALEKLFHARWWDYSKVFFNINGRVCLEGLLFFAVGGFLIIYFIAPIVDELSEYIPNKSRTGICVVLVTLFLTDVVFSFNNPHQGEGITESVTSSTEVSEQQDAGSIPEAN